MPGLDRRTGRTLSDLDHIRQSVADIVGTPVGTRVMRRTYGSYIFELVDAPGNAVGRLRMIAAVADGLERWEPRVRMTGGRVGVDAAGRAQIAVDLVILATGEPITTTVMVDQSGGQA